MYSQIKADLVSRGVTIGEMDLLIGATAKANGLITATLNRKHYYHIEGLAIEDWGSFA